MRLLIITQKLDEQDPILGFFHEWVREFSRKIDKVTVICLEKGSYDLPENVRVLSLGKENGESKIKYIFNFYKYIYKYRKEYDSVFVHMNTVYVLLGWLVWKVFRKEIGLWYAHGETKWDVRLSAVLADILFTSTENGLRLRSKKRHVVGQGIDTEKFTESIGNRSDIISLVTVGRISRVKGFDTLIGVVSKLSEENTGFVVNVVGGAVTNGDKKYLDNLHKTISEKNLEKYFNFLGPMSNTEIIPFIQDADVFVSMSETGSLDKAMLEAMSVGAPVISCNDSLKEILGEYKNILTYNKRDVLDFVQKIEGYLSMSKEEKQKIKSNLRDIVVNNHSLEELIDKIIGKYVS